eukprot:16042-Heterococcus_DN1.PRE.2
METRCCCYIDSSKLAKYATCKIVHHAAAALAATSTRCQHVTAFAAHCVLYWCHVNQLWTTLLQPTHDCTIRVSFDQNATVSSCAARTRSCSSSA